MRVLVSGSTGLIGSAVIPALVAANHEPIRLVRKRVPDDVPVRFWDPSEHSIADDALDGIDAIIHLAGAGIADRRWTERQKARIYDSRVVGTNLLADAIARSDSPPAVFLSGSAIGAYGDRGDEVLTEESRPGSGFLADLVNAWEAAAVVEDPPTRTVTFRTGIVLSSDGGVLGKLLPIFRMGAGGPMGRGRHWMSWISIDDMVGALLWLLDDSEMRGPVNMAAPSPATNLDLSKTLARVLRRPAVMAVPPMALWAVLGRELTREMLFASQRILPERLLEDGFEFGQPDLELALREILDRPE
ncbi:MAG: TIGR01777 family oxidoreductase [Acidimicrobiales bacterium]|nr:TIGR01777 family oxidoreductase [Acidimicrobiales bacterium]